MKNAALVFMVFILMMTAILIAGCTTTLEPEPQAVPVSDLSAYLNDYFNREAILVTPFKKVDIDGKAAYVGTAKDGNDKLFPYLHNLTYIMTNDRNDTKSCFASWINASKNKGYTEVNSIEGLWDGVYGGRYPSDATGEVMINMCQPKHFCGIDYAPEFPNFAVSIDYKTKIS